MNDQNIMPVADNKGNCVVGLWGGIWWRIAAIWNCVHVGAYGWCFAVVRSTGGKGAGVRGWYTLQVGDAEGPIAWDRQGPGVEWPSSLGSGRGATWYEEVGVWHEETLWALVVNVEEVVEAGNAVAAKIAAETVEAVDLTCLSTTTTGIIKRGIYGQERIN